MTTIWKDFTFEAAHCLPGVPPGHPCGRMHGHSYRLQVWARGDVDDKTGMIIDYAVIKKTVQPILEHLDHHTLNDSIPNPTTENVAKWIFNRVKASLPCVFKVVVNESHTTGCVYEE